MSGQEVKLPGAGEVHGWPCSLRGRVPGDGGEGPTPDPSDRGRLRQDAQPRPESECHAYSLCTNAIATEWSGERPRL